MVSMMFVALVALGDLLPLPPPPVTLSLIPEARPFTAPATGESPCALASMPFVAALLIGPPLAMPSNRSVRPPTLSEAVFMALSPTAFIRSDPTPLSLSIASVLVFAMAPYLPVLLRERELDFLVVRLDSDYLAGAFLAGADFLAAVFLAGADFLAAVFLAGADFLAAVFLAGADFLAAVFLAGADFLAAAFFAGAFLAADRPDSAAFEAERLAVRLRGRRSGSGSGSSSASASGSSPSSSASGSSPSSSSPSSASLGAAVNCFVTASRREVAVVRAAALAASISLPVSCSWSFF